MRLTPSRYRLRRQVSYLFTLILVAAAVTAVAGGLALASVLRDQRSETERLEPALAASRDLAVSLFQQETGVRGFVLTRNDALLEPYEVGRLQEAQDVALLKRLLADRPRLLADLRVIEERSADWHSQHAEPQIQQTREGSPIPRTTERVLAGKFRFDALRQAVLTYDENLTAVRRQSSRDLNQATNRLSVLLLLTLSGLVAIVVGAWFTVHRSVLRPLEELGRDVRHVIGGHLDHEVQPVGPIEIAELGSAVEAMRERVVDELEAVREARALADARASELARSNTELEQFAYVASHDLQEPLRKVASFCQLLEKRYAGRLDERADQYIHFATDGAKRMQVLINDLLAFSRVGRTTERFVEVPLASVVADAESNLETALEESGGRVEVEGELPVVHGDRTLLTALFQNLVANGLKFRSQDAPLVRIAVRPAGEDGWELSVTDNGIGIDPRFAERVFVIFQRLHTKEEYAGTGIGLALCRKIVEFHGGRIWVDTGTGAGTTIRFTLPVHADRPAPAMMPS